MLDICNNIACSRSEKVVLDDLHMMAMQPKATGGSALA
jgi:hypothetical protein